MRTGESSEKPMAVGSADSSAGELRSSIEPGCSSEISVSENEQPWVSVVVLNYRNWGDTIECLESLLRLDYPCFEIIVCDNDSRDGSVENILAWARGDLLPTVRHAGVAAPRPSSFEPVVAHRLVPTEQVGLPRHQSDVRLFVLPTGRNGGFSAGNNVGIRFAMARSDVGCVWLLNNDTVVAPSALSAMVARLDQDPGIGICGAKLLNYEQPCAVQALGGASYARWRARARMLLPADFPGLTGPKLTAAVEAQMGYTIGASMLVPRRFIETVGELSESYFLYFEEVDWIRRAQGRFRLGYCPDAVVYHRLGASTGKASHSQLLWFHLSRSRIRFVAQFDPWALPVVFLLDAADALKASLQGHGFRAKGIVRGLLDTGLMQLWALARRRPARPPFVTGG